MNHGKRWICLLAACAGTVVAGFAQTESPMLTPAEQARADAQALEFLKSLDPSVAKAARSTVSLWVGRKQIAYGTVVGDGSQVLTKWSDFARGRGQGVLAESFDKRVFRVKPLAVYEDADLVLLELDEGKLKPVEWSAQPLRLGEFLIAAKPTGKSAAFGVVSVLERDLRESGTPYIGVSTQPEYRGRGFFIREVMPGTPADAVGLRSGDVITAVGDTVVYKALDLKQALAEKKPGDVIDLKVRSGNAERIVPLQLSSMPTFSGSRLRRMASMGTSISSVRDSFPLAIQSDMRPAAKQIGGPVVTLDGSVVGITLARADRTKTYIMPAHAVQEMLKTQGTAPQIAQVRNTDKDSIAAAAPARKPQRNLRQLAPKANIDPETLRLHLGDMRHLLEYLDEEMAGLGE